MKHAGHRTPGGAPRLREATGDEAVFTGLTDPYTVAVAAYVWGMPWVETARIRARGTNPADPFVERPPTSTGAPLNRWGHASVPADPTFSAGVGPSVDLLYSSLRLDTSCGPAVVEVPDCGSRYYTVQVAFADSSAESSYGQRTHGGRLPPLLVQGPGHDAPVPDGMLDVRVPTRYCLMPARFLFDPSAPSDLDAVHALQRGLRVRPLAAYLAGQDVSFDVPAQRPLLDPQASPPAQPAFLHQLGAVLQDEVLPAEDAWLLDRLRSIGLTRERGFQVQQLSEADVDEIRLGLLDGAEIVRRASMRLGVDLAGWTCNLLGPRFGADRLLRAAVAKDQIIVTVPEEALYPVARVDSEGRPLDGCHSYRIDLRGDDLPPVHAFWSVTVYDDDGMLVPNPLGRYAVSGCTPGLVRRPDGGIAIHVGSAPPLERGTTWLPAPEGRFYLMLRLYLPRTAALAGAWRPPPVVRQ